MTFFVAVWFLEVNIVHLELNQYTAQKPPGLLQPPLNPVLFGEPLLALLDDSSLTNNSIFGAYFGQNNFGSMVTSVQTREICLGGAISWQGSSNTWHWVQGFVWQDIHVEAEEQQSLYVGVKRFWFRHSQVIDFVYLFHALFELTY